MLAVISFHHHALERLDHTMLTMTKKGIAAIVLAAFTPLPTNLAAQTDTTLSTPNSGNSGDSGSGQTPRVQSLTDAEIENILSSSKFSNGIARPLAELKFEHHRALGAPLVQCQINAIAAAINTRTTLGNKTLSTDPSADKTIDYATCKKKSDRRKINKQRARNKSLYDALASIGGYYNSGNDQEKTAIILGSGVLINSPVGLLVKQAIGAFANEIKPHTTQASTNKRSTAVIAAALALFDEREFWVVSQEIEAEDNTRQSHNAATGIKIILMASALNRK